MSLTDSQLDDILATIENNPLAVDPAAPTIPINIDSFSREFNDRLQPVMKKIFGKDASLIAMIERTFSMDDTGRVQTETVSINLIMATILSILMPSVKDFSQFVDKKFRAASFTKDGVSVSFSRLGKVFLMTVEAT